jgi:hypothetical protein
MKKKYKGSQSLLDYKKPKSCTEPIVIYYVNTYVVLKYIIYSLHSFHNRDLSSPTVTLILSITFI